MFLIIVYGKILLLFQEKVLKWKNFMFVVPISPKRGYTIENDNKTEGQYMKGQMHTDLGQVIIGEEVIATYAGINIDY